MRTVFKLQRCFRARIKAHEHERAQPPESFAQQKDARALERMEQTLSLRFRQRGNATAVTCNRDEIQNPDENGKLSFYNCRSCRQRGANDAVKLAPAIVRKTPRLRNDRLRERAQGALVATERQLARVTRQLSRSLSCYPSAASVRSN